MRSTHEVMHDKWGCGTRVTVHKSMYNIVWWHGKYIDRLHYYTYIFRNWSVDGKVLLTWNDRPDVVHQFQVRLPGVSEHVHTPPNVSSESTNWRGLPSSHSLENLSVPTLSWHVDQFAHVGSLSNQVQQLVGGSWTIYHHCCIVRRKLFFRSTNSENYSTSKAKNLLASPTRAILRMKNKLLGPKNLGIHQIKKNLLMVRFMYISLWSWWCASVVMRT